MHEQLGQTLQSDPHSRSVGSALFLQKRGISEMLTPVQQHALDGFAKSLVTLADDSLIIDCRVERRRPGVAIGSRARLEPGVD